MGKNRGQWDSILLGGHILLCRLPPTQFLEMAHKIRNNIFWIQITACFVMGRSRNHRHQKKATVGQKTMFIKVGLPEQISNLCGLMFDPVMPRERWMTLFVCPSAVSLVFMSLPASGIFRPSLPSLFVWSLYKQNLEGPPGPYSWNPSPGTNSWNPSSVGRKILDFCKTLPPG